LQPQWPRSRNGTAESFWETLRPTPSTAHSEDINYGLNKFDMVVVDEASMISRTFDVMAATFNPLKVRPVVVFAGDKCQQQPLQTADGRTSATTSINDHTLK